MVFRLYESRSLSFTSWSSLRFSGRFNRHQREWVRITVEPLAPTFRARVSLARTSSSALFILAAMWKRSKMFSVLFQAEDGIRDDLVTGVQTCALPICGGGPGDPFQRFRPEDAVIIHDPD